MKSKRRKLLKDKRSGQYFVRIQVGGVRKYFPLGTQRKAAEVELTRLEHLHESGELEVGLLVIEEPMPEPLAVSPAGDEVTLKEIIDVHLDWVEANRAQATFDMRKHYLTAFLRYAGDRPVSAVDKLTLAGFHGWAKKNHSQGPNGGNIFLRNVKSMFLWAEDMDVCPCPVRRFPYMPETPALTKRFTDEELTLLLNCIKPIAPDFHDMIVFALLTGLRPPELREIQHHHYIKDEDGKEYIEFQRHKTAKSTREPGKRTIPLAPEAVEIINRQIDKHPLSQHIFLNTAGKPYTSGVLRRRLRRWCKRAGIKPRPPYALRHTFGSLEAEANINQAVLAQIMGHTQLRTTARYIAHNSEHHRKAIGAISGRISKMVSGESDTKSQGNNGE